jgi:predicted GNAT family N-acyltransferase
MVNPLAFKQILFNSLEFHEACRLRDIVLRQPLGLSLFDEDLQAEKDQLHFGLFDDSSTLIACVIAAPLSSNTARLRQMAVLPSQINKGYGSNLLRLLENYLVEHGFRSVCLHARSTAIGFYQKLGYLKNGSIFIEVGIPHVHMEKGLQTFEPDSKGPF